MLTLVSYPGLFGVADNNPFGLKVYAFLKLCGMDFRHEHVLDASRAPRAQLPYLRDGDEAIGDSDAIIAHLIQRYDLAIDQGLTPAQTDQELLLKRLLDDLYWVMSYARWKDDAFWPDFRDAFLREHPDSAPQALEAARDYNFRRYHFQGIGRYEPAAVYTRGTADLRVLADTLPPSGFMFGQAPRGIDAAIYGFVANILFYEIETPLKQYVASRPSLVTHCLEMHRLVTGSLTPAPKIHRPAA